MIAALPSSLSASTTRAPVTPLATRLPALGGNKVNPVSLRLTSAETKFASAANALRLSDTKPQLRMMDPSIFGGGASAPAPSGDAGTANEMASDAPVPQETPEIVAATGGAPGGNPAFNFPTKASAATQKATFSGSVSAPDWVVYGAAALGVVGVALFLHKKKVF